MATKTRNFYLLDNLKNWLEKNISSIFLTIICVVALAVRISTWDFVSHDMRIHLLPWYNYIVEHGMFHSFLDNFCNYSPSYLYLISIMTMFRFIPPVLAIKLISIIFDFVAAFFIFKIIRFKYPQGGVPHIACAVFLFAPTVFINSAFWGQVDVLYTTGILAVVYFCMAGKDLPAAIALGIAISFKFQAIFIAPFLLVLILKGRVRWWLFFLVPVIYILSLLPAWAAGRPFNELLSIYLAQSDFYHQLTMNAPNVYLWLDNSYYSTFVNAGILFTLALVIIGAFAFMESKINLDHDVMIILATISVLILPFFLPKMHDRYFYPADVLSIVYAFYFPKYYYIPIAIGLISLMTYIAFLFGIIFINYAYLPFGVLLIIILVIRHLGEWHEPGDAIAISAN